MKYLLLTIVSAGLILSGCSSNNSPVSADDQSISAAQQVEQNDGHRISVNSRSLIVSPGPTITIAASVDTMYQSDGATQTVVFSGTVSDVSNATYVLSDEYGVVAASGSITASPFSISLDLQAIVDTTTDTDGRKYVFTVTAYNAVGGAQSIASAAVVVLYQSPNAGSGGDDDGDGECTHSHHHDHDKGKGHHKPHDNKGHHYGNEKEREKDTKGHK